MSLLAELSDDWSNFRWANALLNWGRKNSGHNELTGKRKSGQKLKGNKHLRRILGEIAQLTART
ncbi:MAG: IS110 family transposase [Deltaproteobacteria bacterium]|nr:IS110 family transposase [Deltaproteobacteria bacterium]